MDDDRRVYLELLRTQAQRFGFWIEGYCLMTNHIHVVGVPAREESLSKALGRAHFLYTQYVNRLHKRSGHLWQSRFYSCAMDEDHALQALCYMELNPVRAGIVKNAWDYPWSSAAAHCGLDKGNPLLDLAAWRERMAGTDWRAMLEEALGDREGQETIRRNTHTGRPLGSDSFLSKVEYVLGRRVRALPVGRQKGWRKKKTASRSHSERQNKR